MQTPYKAISTLLTFVGTALALVLALVWNSPAVLADPAPSDTTDRAHYEAITGESADEDKAVWDSFYRNKSKTLGRDPVSFLKDYVHVIPKGRAFVPAMGEGRNAIFLAKKGFEVDGNDFSEVAVERALGEAKQQKVSFKPIVADLNKYRFPVGVYDLVLISLFYSKELLPKFKAAIKKGGYIMFYNRVADPSAPKSRGDDAPADFSVVPSELKAALGDFKIHTFKEYVDQGVKVVGVLARKP